MRKKFYLFFALIAVFLLCGGALAACGENPDEGKKTVVTYYLYNDVTPMTAVVFDGSFTFDRIPQKEHCAFLGLFDDKTGGTEIVDEYGRCNIVIQNDITLWAHWQGNNCDVTFDAGDGILPSGSQSMSLVYGSVVPDFPVPELEGYTFVGWTSKGVLVSEGATPKNTVFDDSGYTFEPNSDTVLLVAKYEVKQFTLTLDYNDSSYRTDTRIVHYGDALESVDLPQADTGRSEIVGWSTERNRNIPFTGTFNSNITLYAVWRDYKVFRFYTDSETYTEHKVYRDEEYEIPDAEKTGYRFDGWYASQTFSGNPVERVSYGSAVTSYYTKWEAIQYHITFDVDGGDADVEQMSYTIEQDVTLPDAGNKQYCEFVGWCRKQDRTDTPVKTLPRDTYGDITLYAKWKGEDRTVILSAGEGTVSNARRTVEYGANYNLGIAVLDGYEFQGWFTSDNVQMTDKNGNSLSEWTIADQETTLHAEYLKEYFISISYSHEDAGKVEIKSYYIAGEDVSLSVQLLDEGYEIIGFYSNSQLVSAGAGYSFTMPEHDISFNIEFNPRTFNVTLDSGGGYLSTSSVSIDYLDTFSLPVSFKQGYIFDGWAYDGKKITDINGNGLSTWYIKKNVTLKATYIDDPDAANKSLVFNTTTLLAIANEPAKTYVVVSDIDMSGISWTPFAFSGVLNGNGFTIKNLSVSSGSGNLGIFTTISGTISDLKFENLTVASSVYENVFVGGVCGELTGVLSNIHVVSGSISGKTSYIGGIVGKMSSGTISRSSNGATVQGEANDTEGGTAGGICGWFAGGNISDCENRGKVDNDRFTGGIAGYVTALGFSNLKNYGEVIGKDNVGGIFGYLVYGGDMNVNGFANAGNISGENYVGGLIGQLYNRTANTNHTLLLNRLSNQANVQGMNYVGGIMGYIYAEDNRSYNSYVITITATDLENQGEIIGVSYVGGLLGYAFSDSQNSVLRESSSRATVKAEYYLGGLVGYCANIRIVDCANTGSTITAMGKLTSGDAYYAYIGGYVGCGYAVSGCENYVKITYSDIGNYIGGIAGYANGDLEDCKNYANISASKGSGVGGIVGYQDKRGNVSMRSLDNAGEITGNNDVGGIVGRMYDRTEDTNHTITMARFNNSGKVTGGMNVGGVIGYFYAEDVRSYYSYTITLNAATLINLGDVTGTANSGGLFGYGYTDSTSSKISESRSSSTITAEYRIGGIAGFLQNIQIESTSNQGSKIIAIGSLVSNGLYYAYVGGYVGQGYEIRGAVNESDIIYKGKGSYVGGIAGYTNGDLDSDSNSAQISAENSSYVGGIAGYQDKRGNLSITNLSNIGKIIGGDYTGGIIGGIYDRTEDTNHTIVLNALSNSGTIVGKKYSAGIFGYIYADDVKSYNSYTIAITAIQLTNDGDVNGTSYVGGLCGYGYSDTGNSKISDSSSNGAIQAECVVGGLAGQLQSIQLENCSNAGTTIAATGYIVDESSFYAYVGGYVGQGYTVKGCKNESAIIYKERGSYVGGIAGYTNGDIIDCENAAEVNATRSIGVGGIVGFSNGATYTMSNLRNSGKVAGNECVGGIVGRVYAHTQDTNHKITVHLLINESSISGTNYIAGIFGYFYADDVKSYSNYSISMTATEITDTGDVSGVAYVGGFIGYFYTDGNSTMTGYQMTGQVTGTGSHVDSLVGEKTNLTINE